MKIIIAILYYFILCLFNCDRDPCEDKALTWKDRIVPSSFECTIYMEIVNVKDGDNCGPYEVEFEKYHCTGGASTPMSYGFNGCFTDEEGITYLRNMDLGLYTVTIAYHNDYIDFKLKDDSGILYTHKVYGTDMVSLTDYGRDAKGIVVTFIVPDYNASVKASAI